MCTTMHAQTPHVYFTDGNLNVEGRRRSYVQENTVASYNYNECSQVFQGV